VDGWMVLYVWVGGWMVWMVWMVYGLYEAW
jgi:hypothetical protein